MRGVLIVVLGGALLWLVFATFLFDPVEGGAARRASGFAARPAPAAEPAALAPEPDLAPSPADEGGSGAFVAAADPAGDGAQPWAGRDAPSPREALGSGDQDFRATLGRGDRTELGRLLAHERRFQVLESYLNEGDGRELPVGTRKLASAYWLALVGDPAAAELAAGIEGAEGVTDETFELLRTALDGERPHAAAAGKRRPDALALGMRIGLLDRRAEAAVRRSKAREAAEAYSELLQLELAAPWLPERDALNRWSAALNQAQEGHRFDPQGSWPSLDFTVRPNDNLVLIRKEVLRQHPHLLLCTGMIARANRVGQYIQPGDVLRIPTDRPSVLVDLDSHLALYKLGDEVVQAWEIGIGREGQDTPTGTFVVGVKQEEPSHMPIGGRQLPYGHADNPLGTRWIAWNRGGENSHYGFHGTNDPDGVGARVSEGCVRMLNEDVEALFEILPSGATVTVQP